MIGDSSTMVTCLFGA